MVQTIPMKTAIRNAATVLVITMASCSGQPGPSAPAQPGERVEEAAVQDAAGEAFADALEEALVRRSWQDLRLDSECQDDSGRLRSARLFGTGVGIWNHERQFAVSRERLLGLLEELHRAGFGKMPETFGGDDEPDMRLEMICRVEVVLDGAEKQSYQLSRGERSPKLKALADRILAEGEGLGPSGLAAASLEDGLGRLARGELAPEVLTLQLQRQPEDPRSKEGGWILRIEGSEARLSMVSPDTGWGEPRRIRLSSSESADLARALAAARPEDLPANLYSSWYEDLEIQVLNRRKSLQARRFANLTPETHGEKQARFEQLVAVLEALQERLAGR
jgi:hypothetical protein